VKNSLLSFLFVCGSLQVRAGIILEPSDQMLEFFEFSLYSHGGFLSRSPVVR
jgi:hypothetical protein